MFVPRLESRENLLGDIDGGDDIDDDNNDQGNGDNIDGTPENVNRENDAAFEHREAVEADGDALLPLIAPRERSSYRNREERQIWLEEVKSWMSQTEARFELDRRRGWIKPLSFSYESSENSEK